MGKLLEVQHLKKRFPIKKGVFSKVSGYVHAVRDVSFSLETGRILGIVGESGSGKTTVGKCLIGLITPNEGKIVFDGKTLLDSENGIRLSNSEMNDIRKDMQLVFQDPFACLDPRMTILEIVTEGIRKHLKLSKSERVEEAKKLLNRVGLDEGAVYKYPHQFSGGQRQRIGIARALSLNPKLIICDEPTAALDVSIQSQILNLMLDLKKNNDLSYIFISHNLSIVEHFSDDIAVMYCGEIVESGTTKTIFSRTAHPYSLGLIRSVPDFNRSRGRVKLQMTGEIPSTTNLPNGCVFHPRCKYASAFCAENHPELREIEPNHWVACHFGEKVLNDH
ncbi:ABC transporter ATP-binding protein [Guggenheimella bovis]